jgi:DNA-binding PadR family transcriptional regulator
MATRDERDPEVHLPLTPAEFEVLIALADGEKHGYAILKEVTRRTRGEVALGTATLYAILRRFVADGLLAESADRPAASLDDERRRYFGLTEFGRRVAAAEGQRMEKALAMARAKNLIRKPRLA